MKTSRYTEAQINPLPGRLLRSKRREGRSCGKLKVACRWLNCAESMA